MIVEPATSIHGTIRVPGDKSIAHRALILGSIAKGKQMIDGLPHAADVQSTIECLRSLGTFIERMPDGRVLVLAKEFESGRMLDAGNSGTTARLLSGLVAGAPIESTIDGDSSLRRRPMRRITEPLRAMGAEISSGAKGSLPLRIKGGGLKGISYRLPVPSAQVKSAILIAGLNAEGKTSVEEPVPTRDHTERMLRTMKVPVEIAGDRIIVRGGSFPRAANVKIPGDFSSAAFFITAALCLPGSELYLHTTGVNPRRTGLLDVLGAMGANVEILNTESLGEEPAADVFVKGVERGSLQATTVGGDIIPRLIDELPVLAVAATQADGKTVIKEAGELRHKETDRIAAIVTNLKTLGANIEERDDGFVVGGPTRLRGGTVSSFGDHRMAMAMTVAGLLADGKTEIEQSGIIDVSYPDFYNDLRSVLR
jgi:3-phosphoshikimate 1-carboxyvinyltransferase